MAAKMWCKDELMWKKRRDVVEYLILDARAAVKVL